jgi:hypothetical protein
MNWLLLVIRYFHLKALCFAVWAAFNPHAVFSKHSEALADAIATATLFDPSPTFGSAEPEAAVAARYAVEESWLHLRAVGDSGQAHGAFQLHTPAGRGSAQEQAEGWLTMLHDGAVLCPESPAAPLSGGCHRARKLADRRVKAAFEVLQRVETDELVLSQVHAASPQAPKAPAAFEGAFAAGDVHAR